MCFVARLLFVSKRMKNIRHNSVKLSRFVFGLSSVCFPQMIVTLAHLKLCEYNRISHLLQATIIGSVIDFFIFLLYTMLLVFCWPF